ncbi:MAG: DUF3089 domain-containing protein [Sphingomicrobium sp.]
MIRLALLSLVAAFAAVPAAAQAPAPRPDYAQPASWLCLPGRTDLCSRPLATTALNPNGYGSTGQSPVAASPAADCFYVYPTVSRDQGMNSDLIPDGAEHSAVQTQFARFAGVCRTFVPVYRQMTVAAVAAHGFGADIGPEANIAYNDVAAAWRTYLARHNRGRPFVLIGHSQGSAMLIELIRREIEGKPAARHMLRAILPGYNVLVPQGRRLGGSFRLTPTCASATETGCVMSWVSFRERNPPPAGAMFGWAAQPGMTVACTNPARLGSTAWQMLDSYWHTRVHGSAPGGPVIWSSEGAPRSPYLRTEGLVSARCVSDGQRGFLSVRVNADPTDKRTDRLFGEVGMFGFFLPSWGMHLADMAIAQGDLLRLVEVLGSRK